VHVMSRQTPLHMYGSEIGSVERVPHTHTGSFRLLSIASSVQVALLIISGQTRDIIFLSNKKLFPCVFISQHYLAGLVQAAHIAKKAEVGRLLLGHYSSRYLNLDPLLNEAKEIFPNTSLGLEGSRFDVDFKR